MPWTPITPFVIVGDITTGDETQATTAAGAPLVRGFYMPSYGSDDFNHASNAEELDALKAQIANTTHVTATVHVFANGVTSNAVSRVPGSSETPANLAGWFAAAKARGFRPALAIVLHTGVDYGWGGLWNPSDPAAAFASYFTAVQPYLVEAQAAGADFVILADEWSLMFRTSAAMPAFATLFTVARTVYTGAIGIDVNVLEEDDVLPGVYTLCNFLSVNAYLPLTEENSPSVQDMVTALMVKHPTTATNTFMSDKAATYGVSDAVTGYLQYLRLMIGKWQRPALLVVGYKSTTGAAINPPNAVETTADLTIQANAYRAFIEASLSTLGTTILGFNFWRWWPKTTTDATGFSPKGKLAAAVIARTWMQRTRYWSVASTDDVTPA